MHPSIDHFRFPNDDPLWPMPNLTRHMEPGDLMLWDSRTIHCSSPGMGTPDFDDRLFRAASLICMMPKKSNEKVIAKKGAVEPSHDNQLGDRFINADELPQVLEDLASGNLNYQQFQSLTTIKKR